MIKVIENLESNKKKQKIKSVTLRQIKNALKRFNDLTLLNLLDIQNGINFQKTNEIIKKQDERF